MWRVYQKSGRPWPVLCEDDVIDYGIMEALSLKVLKEEKEAEKRSEVNEWKKDSSGLDKLKALAG